MNSSIHYALAIALSVFANLAPTATLASDILISGSVFYRERMALPENAALNVDLVDLAQASGEPVSSTEVHPTGQVPIGFGLSVPADRIEPGKSYGLTARIAVDGATWFASVEPTPIDPENLAAPVSVMVSRVSEEPGSPDAGSSEPVKGVVWHLIGLGDKDADPGVTTTLTFHRDGSVSGNGGCNNFGGHARFNGEALKIDDVFSTMMACEEVKSGQERAFLAALENVASYRLDGDMLVLLDGAGVVVARMAVTP